MVFVVETTSSDMLLPLEAPSTIFDDGRITNGFRSYGEPTLGRRDGITGTPEMGVGKTCAENPGKVVARKFC